MSDVRGLGGDDYKYELIVRAPRPDFQIKIKPDDLSINAGSGKEFAVVAERIDDFDGEINVEVAGLPPGFHASNPLVIQAGQTTAYGTITADADAPAPTESNNKLAKLTATAVINGKQVVKEPVNFGELKLAARSQIAGSYLAIEAVHVGCRTLRKKRPSGRTFDRPGRNHFGNRPDRAQRIRRRSEARRRAFGPQPAARRIRR